jgi:guanylate cyclase
MNQIFYSETQSENESVLLYKQLWRAPELLRNNGPLRGTQKGDVYAFGIILYEMLGRSGPYGDDDMSLTEIIRRVIEPEGGVETRPNIDLLRDIAAENETELPEYVLEVMQECWAEDPETR